MTSELIAGDCGSIVVLRHTKDGSTLVGGRADGTIVRWMRDPGQATLRSIATPSRLERLYDLAISPASDLAAVVGEGVSTLFDLRTGTPGEALPSAEGALHTAVFSPDGHRLLMAGAGEALTVLELEGVREVGRQPAGERNASISFHPDGRTVAVACAWQGGSELRFYRLGAGLEVLDGPVIDRTFDALGPAAFSPDGRYIAFSDRDVHLFTFPDCKPVHAFGFDGRRLEHAEDGFLVDRFWSDVLFTPDGRSLICGSPDGDIFIWEVGSGRLRGRLQGHVDAVLSIDLLPPGDVLVSSGYDGTVRRWRLGGG